jgi:hypothetical protein
MPHHFCQLRNISSAGMWSFIFTQFPVVGPRLFSSLHSCDWGCN